MTHLPANAAQIISIEERNNRIAKARRLADAVWPHVEALHLTDRNLAAEAVRLLPEAARAVAAAQAGTTVPSAQTWAIVTALIATRVERANAGPADPFDGLPR